MYKWIALVLACFGFGCTQISDVAGEGQVRIVSLAPNITEAIFAVGAGDLLVGRTSACNYPAEAEKVAVVGGFGAPSLEMLVKVNPTLVLDSDLADEAIGAKIDALGIPRKRINCSSVDDVSGMMLEIGELTGHVSEGERIAKKIEERLAEIRKARVVGKRVKVYAEVWCDPMTTTGAGTVLSDLITLAGGENIGNATKKKYFQISPERVLSCDPDVILCLYMGKNDGAADALKSRPGWQHIKAVKNDAVFDGLNNDILLRAGPRVLDGVDLLKKCFRGREQGAGGERSEVSRERSGSVVRGQ